jgi:hypothetical protein
MIEKSKDFLFTLCRQAILINMRKIILVLILFCLQAGVNAQPITYNIPAGYENEITKEDYKKLVDLAVPIIAKRYTINMVKDGTIYLKAGQEVEGVNLDNVIFKCVAEKDKSKWGIVISSHFEKLFAAVDEQKTINPQNFESIKKYLTLRIYPANYVMQRGGPGAIVTKTDLEGTFTVLMLDLPNAFSPVQRSHFRDWKKDSAEIFRIAQQHINEKAIEKMTQPFKSGGPDIEVHFLLDDVYAASYALDLMNNSPELVGEWGSVVSMANISLVSICKITKNTPIDFVNYIQRTKPLTEKYYREHEQPVSDQYFWYYKGTFTRIPVSTDSEGKINVVAPLALSTLIAEGK